MKHQDNFTHALDNKKPGRDEFCVATRMPAVAAMVGQVAAWTGLAGESLPIREANANIAFFS
jgi:hypothetical protein